MTDVIPSGRENRASEHVIDLSSHYDEADEPAVFVTVVAVSNSADMGHHGHNEAVSPS